jgi:hypothetical protein
LIGASISAAGRVPTGAEAEVPEPTIQRPSNR